MPDVLRKVVFTLGLLPKVQDFYCGEEEWEKLAADWIKGVPPEDSVISCTNSIERPCQTWLFINRHGEIVGFGSLGESTWRGQNKKDPKINVITIPMIGIHQKFQGCPKGDPPKYSDQILDALRAEASLKSQTHELLGLFVDPKNSKAISLYERHGFAHREPPYQSFLRMALSLRTTVE